MPLYFAKKSKLFPATPAFELTIFSLEEIFLLIGNYLILVNFIFFRRGCWGGRYFLNSLFLRLILLNWPCRHARCYCRHNMRRCRHSRRHGRRHCRHGRSHQRNRGDFSQLWWILFVFCCYRHWDNVDFNSIA